MYENCNRCVLKTPPNLSLSLCFSFFSLSQNSPVCRHSAQQPITAQGRSSLGRLSARELYMTIYGKICTQQDRAAAAATETVKATPHFGCLGTQTRKQTESEMMSTLQCNEQLHYCSRDGTVHMGNGLVKGRIQQPQPADVSSV